MKQFFLIPLCHNTHGSCGCSWQNRINILGLFQLDIVLMLVFFVRLLGILLIRKSVYLGAKTSTMLVQQYLECGASSHSKLEYLHLFDTCKCDLLHLNRRVATVIVLNYLQILLVREKNRSSQNCNRNRSECTLCKTQ